MSKYKEDLQECKEYENILVTIKDSLSDAGFHPVQETKNELVVKGTKKSVQEIIHSLSIPKVIRTLLVSISEASGNVYIRKKMK